jgi:phosphoglycerate dehydrogenase-like enzyme
MFNLEAFRHMRPGSLLINVGRGETVDEPALLYALQEGQIAGAGLDVLPTEPLPDNHPLWDMENVIITPHVAGDSPLRSERVVDLFCTNLQRYAAGLPLMGLVDKQEGY